MEMEGCDLTGGKLEQLDFNAPLISTRRLGGLAGGDSDGHQKSKEAAVDPSPGDACTSVPFLWEAAPGVPKVADREHERDEAAELPRPPPPPSRWRPPGDDCGGGGRDSDTGRRGGPDDSGHEGDVDNGSGGEDLSYNSADLASPTDSLSVACSLDQADGVLDAVCVEEGGDPCRSPFPGFMMQRFLPAAAAVAASFPSDDAPRKPPRRAYHAPARHHQYYHPREKMTIEAGLQLEFARRSQSTRSYSSSKACGITVFFPWGFKQAFCGLKSSVQSRASFDKRNSHGSSRGPAQDGGPRHSFRSEGADSGGAAEARRARSTWDTPGWGLRFLDCRGCEGVAVAERGSEGNRGGTGKDHGRTTWSLPLLRSPSEPWLAQALRSISKGTE